MAKESRLSEWESGFNTLKSKGIRLSALLSDAESGREHGIKLEPLNGQKEGGKAASRWELENKE